MDFKDAVQHLRGLREAAGLTVDRVAGICGVSRGRLANYESFQRTPDLDTLRAWARVFNQEVVFEVRPPAATSAEFRDRYKILERLALLDPERASILEDLLSFTEAGDITTLRQVIQALAAVIVVPEPGESGYTGGRRGAAPRDVAIGVGLGVEDRKLLKRVAALLPKVTDEVEREVVIRMLEVSAERGPRSR